MGIAIIGGADTFVGECGERASFVSHVGTNDMEDDFGHGCLSDLMKSLSECRKTVVCVVNGRVSGGFGLEFIMSCDYRVVSEESHFSGNEASASSTDTAVSKKHLAMNKLLSGASITALEARDIGLVDEVVSDALQLESIARQVALKCRKRVRPILSKNKASRLLEYIPEQFLLYRTHQLFNLIRDFPESLPILEELKEVILLTSQGGYVISQLKNQLADRLLIPGAHTEDVLQMYLRTYKVVRFLFSESVKLREVFLRIAKPIIDHLQKRSDSVKCIVSALLDDEGEDEDSLETSTIGEDDTLSLLIGVYGGKDSFLAEYRDMLALRLVNLGSFEIDREVASLELMRSKFSDTSILSSASEALMHCSVMIKDIIESKNLNVRIKTQLMRSDAVRRMKKHHNMLTMIVKSGHFWPCTFSSNIGESSSSHVNGGGAFSFLPEAVQETMREYERLFTELKPTQKIEWNRTEGVVTLGIQMNNDGAVGCQRETEFRVSPIHVQVLALFQPRMDLVKSAPESVEPSPTLPGGSVNSLSIESIASAVCLATDQVKAVLQFWVSRNVLREIEINKYAIAQ